MKHLTLSFALTVLLWRGCEIKQHNAQAGTAEPVRQLVITRNYDNDSLVLFDVCDSTGCWPELTIEETDSIILKQLK